MKTLSYEIVIEREEDPQAGYSVYCPDLPGCFSNGGSVAEAKVNMREAIELHLESLTAHGEPVPQPRHSVQIATVDLAIPSLAGFPRSVRRIWSDF